MKLELEAPEATLVLDANERGWCQVVLRLPDGVLALGGEMHKTVIARLINGVSDRPPGPISGRSDGVPRPLGRFALRTAQLGVRRRRR
jgi:hypothetical protein